MLMMEIVMILKMEYRGERVRPSPKISEISLYPRNYCKCLTCTLVEIRFPPTPPKILKILLYPLKILKIFTYVPISIILCPSNFLHKYKNTSS